jgi:hypothetical protein
MRHFPEIVKVVDPHRLIDSESYEHLYWTARPRALIAGYYIVTWPDHVLRSRFDESACFAGPFRTPAHARAALELTLDPRQRKSA